MADRFLDIAAWLHKRRRALLRVSDGCLAGVLWCFLVYFLGANLVGGKPIVGSDLRDTVVSNSITLKSQGDTINRLEGDQSRQWGIIGSLQMETATFRAEMTALKEGQEGVTHILYVILAAIILKSIIDVMRDDRKTRGHKADREEED